MLDTHAVARSLTDAEFTPAGLAEVISEPQDVTRDVLQVHPPTQPPRNSDARTLNAVHPGLRGHARHREVRNADHR